MNDKSKQLALTVSERDWNAIKSAVTLVPGVGSALAQLMFGVGDELRWSRVEKTLTEIGEKLVSLGADIRIEGNEDFLNLMEGVIPPLSRSTNEDRRQRFRDLILNAAQLSGGDKRWEELYHCSKLLDSISAPGLALLAGVARLGGEDIWFFSMPVPYLFSGIVDLNKWDHDSIGESAIELNYNSTIISDLIRDLGDLRLLGRGGTTSKGAIGPFGLTPMGELLVRWTVGERLEPSDQHD